MMFVRTALLLVTIAGSIPAQAKQDKKDAGWGVALDFLQTQVEEYRDRLDAARETLKERAVGQEKLLGRLKEKVPKSVAHGYGLLPKLLKDLAVANVRLYRNTFSIARLTSRAAPVWRDTFQLAEQAKTGANLAVLVTEFERLKRHLTWVQRQVSYHRFWQKSVVKHARFFALKNRILKDAQKLKALVDRKGDAAEIEKLRVLIEAKVAPFNKTAGLQVEVLADGSHVLPVHLVTDIQDEAFLRAFEKIVDDIYNRSAAAIERKFRIDLKIERIPLAKLFGKEVPARGTPIDEKALIARFPKDRLILTTGGKTTHAFVGRYVQLGSSPTRRRVIAHEFGHLLGFGDAYLRGYSGTPNSKLGCTLIEWVGLQNNLMGAPGTGRVTPGMIKRLIDAYGPRKVRVSDK